MQPRWFPAIGVAAHRRQPRRPSRRRRPCLSPCCAGAHNPGSRRRTRHPSRRRGARKCWSAARLPRRRNGRRRRGRGRLPGRCSGPCAGSAGSRWPCRGTAARPYRCAPVHTGLALMTGRTRQTSEVTYKHEVADPHRVGGIPPAAEDLVVGVLRADVREALALPAAQQRAQPRPRRDHRRRPCGKRAELARERSVAEIVILFGLARRTTRKSRKYHY